eukprot:12902147-Prorocentrum_lima.AAC.1
MPRVQSPPLGNPQLQHLPFVCGSGSGCGCLEWQSSRPDILSGRWLRKKLCLLLPTDRPALPAL